MNLPTLIILLLVLAAVVLALVSLRRSTRKGGCSCGCAGCSMKGRCGSEQNTSAE